MAWTGKHNNLPRNYHRNENIKGVVGVWDVKAWMKKKNICWTDGRHVYVDLGKVIDKVVRGDQMGFLEALF